MKKILTVDDDLGLCKLIAKTLGDAGYAVQIATSGESAIDAYEQDRPDLILLDIAMPGMNGWDVASTIRQKELQQTGDATRIVIMSAHARAFDVSVNFQTGIDGYIGKPVSPSELTLQVHKFLSGRRQLDWQS